MIRALTTTLAAVAAFAATPALAYGQFGHNTIAQIAMANVSPATAAKVRVLLARSSALATPQCPAGTVEDASVWADCVRAKYPLRFGYASSWHYQTLDICGTFDLKAACRDGNCVSAQVDRDVKLLQAKDTPLPERVQALALLIHFTGDMHMPLHSGSHNDSGGNAVKAAYGIYAPDRLNLHGIWDGQLAERAITDGPNLVRRYTATEAAPLQAGTTEDWSRESYDIARTIAYPSATGDKPCVTPTARVTLDEATIARLVPVQRLQVQRAGLRLARLLDEAFAG
ncbi:MAG: S1/P1 nuclease [Sphingomonas sp.]|nr:S1/P1 nuclease [Sphingomonas sp.]